jgi:hypothetical protein
MSVTFVSGGAQGADTLWAMWAVRQGQPMDVMSFPGHRRSTVKGAKVFELSNKELDQARPHLTLAGDCLGRSLAHTSEFSMKYLLRDWHIIKNADAVFAIGNLISGTPGIRVAGGTGWTCQMYFNRGPPVNMWLFNQFDEQWYKCSPVGDWEESIPPTPEGFTRVALIGSREITKAGAEAISHITL